ncbi:hypothetical protein JCM19238_349 [Vibrio ponticus]|nr:hypothetical protein JCM19238_349 [Vibrio ponticus]
MVNKPQLRVSELVTMLNGLDVRLIWERLVELGWVTKFIGGYKPRSRSVGYEFVNDSPRLILTEIGIRTLYKFYRDELLPMKDDWDGSFTKVQSFKQKLQQAYTEKLAELPYD